MGIMTMDTFSQAPLSVTTLSAQRAVYLDRLERLQRLRVQHEGELNSKGIRLLDRSVFAAYCACREIGAEREALDILNRIASEQEQPLQSNFFSQAS